MAWTRRYRDAVAAGTATLDDLPEWAQAYRKVLHHRHVYFSDLRGVAAEVRPLSGRLFYGCIIDPEAFAGAIADHAVCCAGVGTPPGDAAAVRAIEDGLRGDWDRAWALLERPSELAPGIAEHLVVMAAVGMIDARMEVRLRAMTRVARLIREHPRLLPADAREVLQAFLLYRAADDSDMVYYDAVALIDELKLPPSAVEHLVGRARSPDPRERVEALVARRRMWGAVATWEPPYPLLAALLDDSDPEVQLALLQLLRQVARYSWDAEALLPGVDLPEKLNLLLRSRDDRVRREAILYAQGAGGPANREALTAALQDPDPDLRDRAFKTLYLTLPPDQLRDFLLHHEPTPAQREFVLESEARWREQGSAASQICDTAELREMLASDDPQRRRSALILAGFTGDPALAPDAEAALRDADPRVRALAEQLLGQLRERPDPG